MADERRSDDARAHTRAVLARSGRLLLAACLGALVGTLLGGLTGWGDRSIWSLVGAVLAVLLVTVVRRVRPHR